MTIKITIKKNSLAASKLQQLLAEKDAFKKAIEKGKAIEYGRNNPKKFSRPL